MQATRNWRLPKALEAPRVGEDGGLSQAKAYLEPGLEAAEVFVQWRLVNLPLTIRATG